MIRFGERTTITHYRVPYPCYYIIISKRLWTHYTGFVNQDCVSLMKVWNINTVMIFRFGERTTITHYRVPYSCYYIIISKRLWTHYTGFVNQDCDSLMRVEILIQLWFLFDFLVFSVGWPDVFARLCVTCFSRCRSVSSRIITIDHLRRHLLLPLVSVCEAKRHYGWSVADNVQGRTVRWPG